MSAQITEIYLSFYHFGRKIFIKLRIMSLFPYLFFCSFHLIHIIIIHVFVWIFHSNNIWTFKHTSSLIRRFDYLWSFSWLIYLFGLAFVPKCLLLSLFRILFSSDFSFIIWYFAPFYSLLHFKNIKHFEKTAQFAMLMTLLFKRFRPCICHLMRKLITDHNFLFCQLKDPFDVSSNKSQWFANQFFAYLFSVRNFVLISI